MGVWVTVREGAGVLVTVRVGEGVGVRLGVGVLVRVGVRVNVRLAVIVGVRVRVGALKVLTRTCAVFFKSEGTIVTDTAAKDCQSFKPASRLPRASFAWARQK